MSKSSTLRHISAVCILIAACILCAAPASAAEFSGSGTADNPYLIQSNADMKKLAELVNAGNADYSKANYLLTTDLALEDEEWVPIGSSMSKAFSGVFDGNEKSVTYSIEKPASKFAGLFGCNSGTIKNLNLKCTISGTYDDIVIYAGGVCGMNLQGIIENCMIYAEIDVASEAAYAGGVAGYDSDGLISQCSAEVEIFAEALEDDVGAGGVVGETYGTVKMSGAVGSVSAKGAESVYVGGIAGTSTMQEITGCDAAGTVSAEGTSDDMYAGGLVGMNQGIIDDSDVKRMKVSAICSGEGWTYTYVGGITGRNYDSGEVRNIEVEAEVFASASAVPSDDNNNWPQVLAGGLAGYNEGTFESCVSYGSVSAKADGEVLSDALIGLNEGEMKDCRTEKAPSSSNTPSDDSAESLAPLAGVLLGGLCAALLLRRK